MPTCYFPRLIRNPNYSFLTAPDDGQLSLMMVPCGKCYACLSARRRQWLFRLKQESLHSKFTFFITLTYNDENNNNHLRKEDLHNFLRRIRRDHGVKYYSIGEYGTRTKRPHYHIILFVKDSESSLSEETRRYNWIYYIRSKWNLGNVVVSEANVKRLNYICHYHTRPKRIELPDGTLGETFCLMSKGIGLQFMTPENLEIIKTRKKKDVFDLEGQTITLPRYYRKKFDIEPPEPMYDTKSLLQQAEEFHMDPFNYLMDMRDKDTKKMTKYDNQEKL